TAIRRLECCSAAGTATWCRPPKRALSFCVSRFSCRCSNERSAKLWSASLHRETEDAFCRFRRSGVIRGANTSRPSDAGFSPDPIRHSFEYVIPFARCGEGLECFSRACWLGLDQCKRGAILLHHLR